MIMKSTKKATREELIERINELEEEVKEEKEKWKELLHFYNQRVSDIIKLENKIEDLENGDLTTVYMSGFYDGEKKWKDKIKKEIERLKEIENPLVYRMNDTAFINGIEHAKQILQRILHGGKKE